VEVHLLSTATGESLDRAVGKLEILRLQDETDEDLRKRAQAEVDRLQEISESAP
jgi:hypothetical protein